MHQRRELAGDDRQIAPEMPRRRENRRWTARSAEERIGVTCKGVRPFSRNSTRTWRSASPSKTLLDRTPVAVEGLIFKRRHILRKTPAQREVKETSFARPGGRGEGNRKPLPKGNKRSEDMTVLCTSMADLSR